MVEGAFVQPSKAKQAAGDGGQPTNHGAALANGLTVVGLDWSTAFFTENYVELFVLV